MSEIGANGANEITDLGNTKTKSCVKKKRITQTKRWCFTLNNYTEDDVKIMRGASGATFKKFIFSREIGESGTPHLQGFFESLKKCRPMELFKNKKIHWEKTKGSDMDNVIYIEKDHDVVLKFGLPEQPRPLKLIEPDRPYQVDILNMIKSEPDDRSIYWYWESKGNVGKSCFTKYLCARHNALMVSGKSADCKFGVVKWKEKRGDTPDLIIYNIPRSFNSEYVSYEVLESLKDMCFFSGKYESEMVVGNAPHLLVFANEPPNVCKMSMDRWKVFEITEDFHALPWSADECLIDTDDELDM